MSQSSVEKLLGRILTDDDFRRSFFPLGRASFELAAANGLDLTPIERSALCSLNLRRFEILAQTLDPRISRSPSPEDEAVGAVAEAGREERGS